MAGDDDDDDDARKQRGAMAGSSVRHVCRDGALEVQPDQNTSKSFMCTATQHAEQIAWFGKVNFFSFFVEVRLRCVILHRRWQCDCALAGRVCERGVAQLFVFSVGGSTRPLGCCVVTRCAVMYCTVMCCTVMYCFVMYCTVLYCFVMYCFVVYCFVVYWFVMYCFVVYHFAMYCFAMYCFVMYSFVVY